jgi:Abnormal spindle-like microcephaly-assoc'd, ASPM-SPD-2-Hydin
VGFAEVNRGVSAQVGASSRRNEYLRHFPMQSHRRRVPRVRALFVFATILLTAIIQAGCSGVTSARSNSTSTNSKTTSFGTLSMSPAAVTFGNVPVGSTGNQSLTITNSGSSPVTISQASATGTGFSVAGASMPLTLSHLRLPSRPPQQAMLRGASRSRVRS